MSCKDPDHMEEPVECEECNEWCADFENTEIGDAMEIVGCIKKEASK